MVTMDMASIHYLINNKLEAYIQLQCMPAYCISSALLYNSDVFGQGKFPVCTGTFQLIQGNEPQRILTKNVCPVFSLTTKHFSLYLIEAK